MNKKERIKLAKYMLRYSTADSKGEKVATEFLSEVLDEHKITWDSVLQTLKRSKEEAK